MREVEDEHAPRAGHLRPGADQLTRREPLVEVAPVSMDVRFLAGEGLQVSGDADEHDG
jgi:hypothetical protein